MIDWKSLKEGDTYETENEVGEKIKYVVIEIRDGVIFSKPVLN